MGHHTRDNLVRLRPVAEMENVEDQHRLDGISKYQ
jgi:hypothetical protein